MDKTLLISLVSDQTLPNVQMIKEFGNENTEYLFITTTGMEKKGCRQWIENTCNLKDVHFKEVNQFSYDDMHVQLDTFDFDSFDRLLVNLTGGTKIMTLAASDFFKEKAADIYYITGHNTEYIQTFPKRKKNAFKLSGNITVREYLSAYGFEVENHEISGFSFDCAERIFRFFCNNDISPYREAIELIVAKRGKRRNISGNEFDIVAPFLDAIKFCPSQTDVLSRKEIKYLSGEWFEEYVGLRLKSELNYSDDYIAIGTVVRKNTTTPINDIGQLLDSENVIETTDNELDVIFMLNDSFHVVECKSSILAVVNGKEKNILSDTIYKADSLKNRFGLFAKTSIATLTDFKAYCQDDQGKRNSMIKCIERANSSRIKLADKAMLRNAERLIDIFTK